MNTVLIIGVDSGVGLGCAKILVPSCKLILCSRNVDELRKSKDFIKRNLSIYKVDVRSSADIKSLFEDIKYWTPSLDVVVNSAGLVLGFDKLEDGNISNWEQVIETYIKGFLMISKYALQLMKRQNSGEIINSDSISGINSYSIGVVDSTSKASVKSVSYGLRKELIDKKIKITNIQSGLVDTNFINLRFYGDNEKAKEVYDGVKPLLDEDIAKIIYLINLHEHVQINEITMTSIHQASVEVVHRKL